MVATLWSTRQPLHIHLGNPWSRQSLEDLLCNVRRLKRLVKTSFSQSCLFHFNKWRMDCIHGWRQLSPVQGRKHSHSPVLRLNLTKLFYNRPVHRESLSQAIKEIKYQYQCIQSSCGRRTSPVCLFHPPYSKGSNLHHWLTTKPYTVCFLGHSRSKSDKVHFYCRSTELTQRPNT